MRGTTSSLFTLLLAMAITSLAIAQSTTSARKSIPLGKPVLLWPQGAPGASGDTDEDKPAIFPVIPEKSNGTAMLVIPGGGFMTRATDHEGVLVSQYLAERGITCFILRYRIRPLYNRSEWLADAQRALQYIRANAQTLKIAPNRIGAIGFSAGADLVYDASLNPLSAKPDASNPLERASSRPDFQVLVYGGSPQRPATEPGKLAALPPAFMFCTAEDVGHVRGMSALYSEFLQAGVPVEAHFFLNGEHGVGFALGDPVLGEYPAILMNWMIASGFLTGKERLPVAGVVNLDGSPLVRGILILTPVDDPQAPPLVVYITNASTRPMAQFSVSEKQGLVPGRYRVEVRQDATRWLSNSRDPVMIRMTEKQRSGTLTDEDRRQWGEHVRKRDLSPSIENQRVFSRQHPGDKQDYVVQVRSGVVNSLNIEVFSK
jgi:acetyl esterase/lipase